MCIVSHCVAHCVSLGNLVSVAILTGVSYISRTIDF